jgi:hypothetical protein
VGKTFKDKKKWKLKMDRQEKSFDGKSGRRSGHQEEQDAASKYNASK